MIDLRSDTVTKPCKAMRQAIAQAVVGDDVFEEDPTVRELEALVAEHLGKERGLFVPSGLMSNQIALNLLTERGDEVVCGAGSHIIRYEAGAASFLSGIQITQISGDGRFRAQKLRDAFQNGFHTPRTRVVALEHSHNYGGGILWQLEELESVLAQADELGLAKHLDGARLWNAAAATKIPERTWARNFDTVSVCLSKGLGAPVGSVLCASADNITKARRIRKMLGGAMRQSGILAAGGLYAFKYNRERLSQDHERARILANGLNEVPGLSVDLGLTHTNIVMVQVSETRMSTAALCEHAASRGLHFFPFGPGRIRLVTHGDLHVNDVKGAIEILNDIMSKP